MSDVLTVDAGDLDAEAIIEAMHDGSRIVIQTTVLGEAHTVTLRYDGQVYYCDTPTRLHRHEDETEMRACIDKMGYGSVRTNESMVDGEE